MFQGKESLKRDFLNTIINFLLHLFCYFKVISVIVCCFDIIKQLGLAITDKVPRNCFPEKKSLFSNNSR